MNKVYSPLNKRNIIITRAKDQISEVKIMFQNAGAKIFDLPALIIDYPDNIKPLDNALNDIDNFEWIIFSSCNGIKFIQNRLIERGLSLQNYSETLKIAVVGEKTSQYLKKTGLKADYIPPDFIADSLVQNFPVNPKGLRVLIPRVQTGGRKYIIDQLINAGALVKEVAAYESKCPEFIPLETIKIINDKKVDAILFSSGKIVQNTAFLLKKHFGRDWKLIIDGVSLLTIGPQTTEECKKQFGRVDEQASKYTFEGLLQAAINHFN